MKKKKPNPYLCPTCHQNMADPPHKGLNDKNCPQCGQGMNWRKARIGGVK